MYKLNSAHISDELGKDWNTYGITFNNLVIHDISVDKNKVQKLISICNLLDLSPIHIYDVIDDFFVDFKV